MMSSNSGGGSPAPGTSQSTNETSQQHPHNSRDHSNNNQCYSNLIYDSEVFLTKLREFKPRSLGSLEARRKSSSTLIFPNPPQACVGSVKCPRYPHDVKPTPGYWIECHGPGIYGKISCPSQALATEHTNLDFRPTPDEPSISISNEFGRLDLGSSNIGQQFKVLIDVTQDSQTSTTPYSTREEISRSKTRDSSDIGIAIPRTERASSMRNISLDDDSGLKQGCSSPSIGMNGKKGLTTTDTKVVRKGKGDTKKKVMVRMMTRDDIDLHKPRRATPNITITEPSFNQPTISFTAKDPEVQAPITDSEPKQSHVTTVVDSNEQVDYCEAPVMIHEKKSYNETSIINIDTNIRHDSHEDKWEPDSLPDEGCDYNGSLFRYQQHRPSVIQEDTGDTEDILESKGENSTKTTYEQGEFYCGLSTTTFQKKSYQQTLSNPPDISMFKDGPLELISFDEENYEKYYYGCDHWNYFTNDELLGPVMLSLKQEVNNQRDHFHVLLRTVSYTLHGTIPASTICADRYDREAIVRELSEIAKLKPPLMLGQLPTTPDELLKLDHIFIKTELKVGVIYIKEGQTESEEAILGNKGESPLFTEFLDLLGDRIKLKGFDRYKGGLDTVHNLTGTESVYTFWRNIEIMFHVSTMLPHEENDPQKLQKKRHIGNDIVCVAFIESDDTLFWPGCIKSYFLHTFITVRTSPKAVKEGEKRKYYVSCVCRNEVQYAFKPYLVEKDEFFKSDSFREWLLVKIVNGERASYSAPKFARMQDRTRSQILEDIITNLANHLVTGQIPKPYRRGSWRPLGHTRCSSPLEDSMKDYFEDYDQLAKDFCNAFCGPSRSMLCDVNFKVMDKDGAYRIVHGVRAIMAIRSRPFLEMLYGFVPPGTALLNFQNQSNLREIEMRALSGGGSMSAQSKGLLVKRGSVGADTGKKIEERERRQSMLPNLSRAMNQKPNYLTVPSTSAGGAVPSGSGGVFKNAINRLGNWSGWGSNVKGGYKGDSALIKVEQDKDKWTNIAVCKEIAKIDSEKLLHREFEIKEFDYETIKQIIEYIHNGQSKLSLDIVPSLICAAEHYDLQDLVHACFHYGTSNMKLSTLPKMMNSLNQSAWIYASAQQLLDYCYKHIDSRGDDFFSKAGYLELEESVLTALLNRKTLQVSEIKKFEVMNAWIWNQLKLKGKQGSEPDYQVLMKRLNTAVNLKLDKISDRDLVRHIVPSKVFSNEMIYKIIVSRDSD